MLRSVSSPVRAGFTLIELLITIAIIGILAGLVTMGVMRVMSAGPDAADLHEIEALSQALEKFKVEHKLYPPDFIKLCHFEDDYSTTEPLDIYSKQYISRMWPQIFKRAKSATDPVNKEPIPWAGFNPDWSIKQLPPHPVTGQKCVVLQGDQCLVFFLGGPGGVRGFSENVTFPIHDPAPQSDTGVANPFFPPGTQYNKKSYYNFPAARLRPRPMTAPTDKWSPWVGNVADQFPSFYDNYSTERTDDKPFVYFVANEVGAPIAARSYNPFQVAPPPPPKSAIADLGNVQPYFEGKKKTDSAGRPRDYYNASSFQIITAGKDKLFGPIGQWYGGDSAQAGANEDWKDNRANFHDKQLGK